MKIWFLKRTRGYLGMEFDEESEEFILECCFPSETDFHYEFDAARFFDFSRPESCSEAEEAERWFESSGNYPPSTFTVKLKWSEDNHLVDAICSPYLEDVHIDSEVPPSEGTGGRDSLDHTAEDILKGKTKSMAKPFKPRSSTLLKPTVSHLAKQNKARDVYSNRSSGRLQKPLTKVEERSFLKSPSPGLENQATKRQKLENGYLHKVAQLKHQTLLLHKIAKKFGPLDANFVNSRSKITVPREPDLETAQRAERRRSKNQPEPGQHANLNGHMFKARPLNRKILEAPSLLPPKKSTPKLPKFQVFRLKTSERAMQHLSANALNTDNSDSVDGNTDFRGPNSGHVKQENSETQHKSKARPPTKVLSPKRDTCLTRNNKEEGAVPMEYDNPTDKKLSQDPPIELFNKLSLKSELETSTTSQAKSHLSNMSSKENALHSFQPALWRGVGKPSQCWGDRKFHEVGSQHNINRSLDIR